jgi:2-polyprenyl-3-methyl-5-hydroxy-6-metoxy-1,4-benzoquinol methylase
MLSFAEANTNSGLPNTSFQRGKKLMTETATTPDINAIKSKMKTIWSAGDFGKIAEIIQDGANEFVERLDPKPGETVLDVACGTGNTAIPAA